MSASAILIATVLIVLAVLGLALLAGSLALLGTREIGTRRSGLREALRLLDRQWQIERLVYRHHRLFGILVLAAGAFCLWQFSRTELSGLLEGGSPASVLVWALLFGQGFNLLVGLVILFRPSMLKPVEAFSNRWHDLAVIGTGQPRRVRLTAVLLALVGLAVLIGSVTLLIQQSAPFLG